MNKGAAGRGWRWGRAALVATSLALGYATASLLLAGPRSMRERAPIGAIRAMAGAARGRKAGSPVEIPPRGWWEIIVRVAVLTARNRLMAEAAAVTFFSLLAIFPALAAVVSLYSLVANPSDVERLLDLVSDVLPSGALDLLRQQLHALIAHGQGGLSLGVGLWLTATLWSANQGCKALFESLNVIYRETETRNYAVFVLSAFVFTFGAILFVIVALVGVVAMPEILRHLGISHGAKTVVQWLRWPVILLTVTAFLSGLYRFGPSRQDPKWRWVTLGGALAAVSWVAVSFAFSWYVQNFGSFDRTYGSLGAIIGFMIWIWLSTLVALVGAQLNSETEHQTGVDTTTGAPMPLGLRGATQADTVA